MKKIDPEAMGTPRSVCCEHCGLYCRRPTERHHIVPRGMGGGSRLDIPENLIDLGGDWDCSCHARAQNGVIARHILQKAVARRLGTTARKVANKVNRMLRAPKP